MSPAMIFVVPAVTAVMLALASGVAYRQTGRRYLLWWTGVWLVSLAYYVAVMLSVLVGRSQTDLFTQLGLLTTLLGWLRGASLWAGARVLAGRSVGVQFCLVAAAIAATLFAVVVGTPLGQQATGTITRLTYAVWFFLGAFELLRKRPRSAVGTFCGLALLLLGTQGVIASQLTLDLAGSMMSGWISTGLALALGLGVLGRMLEEEREVARARSHELSAANARLAELDQLKSDFVSMVSHELRTPLGLIKGYAGTLLNPGLELDDSTRREFVQIIDDEADQLTELVANLLDMSRIEAGTLRVDPHPADLARLLAECSTRLHVREPERVLELDLPSGLPPVLADERRIVQVVDNLLTNAARYTPMDTKIVLQARANGESVAVSVVDRGGGIPAEMRDQIFEKFVRLDEGDRASVGGSGLGLAICRGIVQAHGGAIWVESERGKGSTFAFNLPLSDKHVDEVRV
jgi:signal transduction histidine kinase